MNTQPCLPPQANALTHKFVRVTERRADGFVAFEFSIGWPELAVELLLPTAAFESFCAGNSVVRLDVEDATTIQPTNGDKL